MDNSNNSDNSDNSGNRLTGSASRVYNNALMNIFDRILEPENDFTNTNRIFHPPPFIVNSGNITRRHRPVRSPFSNLLLPSFSNNQNMRNLLYTTLNQKNKYKRVLSEKGKTQLKQLKFTSTMKNDKCPILLENFKEGDNVCVLPCHHVFTPSAIEEWLNDEQAKCPVCRFELDSKEIKDRTLYPLSETLEDNSSDDSMPELEDIDEIEGTENSPNSTPEFSVSDISNNSQEEDTQLLSIIENLMRVRMRNRRLQIENRNFIGSFNNTMINYEHDRAVQEAILASIEANNRDSDNENSDD